MVKNHLMYKTLISFFMMFSTTFVYSDYLSYQYRDFINGEYVKTPFYIKLKSIELDININNIPSLYSADTPEYFIHNYRLNTINKNSNHLIKHTYSAINDLNKVADVFISSSHLLSNKDKLIFRFDIGDMVVLGIYISKTNSVSTNIIRFDNNQYILDIDIFSNTLFQNIVLGIIEHSDQSITGIDKHFKNEIKLPIGDKIPNNNIPYFCYDGIEIDQDISIESKISENIDKPYYDVLNQYLRMHKSAKELNITSLQKYVDDTSFKKIQSIDTVLRRENNIDRLYQYLFGKNHTIISAASNGNITYLFFLVGDIDVNEEYERIPPIFQTVFTKIQNNWILTKYKQTSNLNTLLSSDIIKQQFTDSLKEFRNSTKK